MALREVCDSLRIDLPDDLFDTIGGFVFGQLRRIPKVDDRVVVEGGEFRVERMNGRRVEFVDFRRQEKR